MEKITIKGKTKIILFDQSGKIKATREMPNLITDDGFDFMCRQIGESVLGSAHWCGIGSGTTGADHDDSTLESQLARVSGVYEHTLDTKVYKNESTFPAGTGTGAVTEAGMLNAETGGVLLNRQTFGSISKGANDILKIESVLVIEILSDTDYGLLR